MTWSIKGQLLTENVGSVTGFVKKVHWAYDYTDQGVVGETNGFQEFSYDPSSPFTPFADLTEDQVVGWVKDALGPEAVSFYETKVAEAVAEAIASEEPNPKKIFLTVVYTGTEQDQPAPWATPV